MYQLLSSLVLPSLVSLCTAMLRALRLPIALTGFAMLVACSWFRSSECTDKNAVYLHVEDHAPLQIPANLDTPDRHNLFVVPATKTNASPKGKCLDTPPAYFGTTGRLAASPEETVADWAQAWADRNIDAVIGMYSTHYGSSGTAVSLEQRRAEVINGPAADGRVKSLKVSTVDNDRQLAKFTQQFGSTIVHKELTLVRESGVWKILDEKVITAK